MINIQNENRHADIELQAIRDGDAYRLVRGQPRSGVYYIEGEPDSPVRLGIWECTEGAFEVLERGNELQTMLQGRLKVINQDGTESEYSAGDSFFTQDGETVIWDIQEKVRKIFYSVR